jgi:hypothetical protein
VSAYRDQPVRKHTETISVKSEDKTKLINIICKLNVESLTYETEGTYNYHYVLKRPPLWSSG